MTINNKSQALIHRVTSVFTDVLGYAPSKIIQAPVV